MSDKPGHNVSTMPTKAQSRNLRECNTLQEAFDTKEFRDRIAYAIPKHLDPDTTLRTFIQAASKTPLIYKCDLRQSLGAFMSLSYLGLPPNTALQLSHLIPFKTTRWNPKTRQREEAYDLNVIIGYPGYQELAMRSGFVKDIRAGIVFPGEEFDHEHGTHKFLKHKQNVDLDTSGLTPRCSYAYVSMINEGDEFEIMPWAEVLSIRNRSQAYKTALAAKERAESEGKRIPSAWTEAPWVRDAAEMGRKSAFRRLAKWLPKCPELRAGVALEEAQDRGRLDFGPVIDGTVTPEGGIPEMLEEEQTRDPGSIYGVRDIRNTTIEHVGTLEPTPPDVAQERLKAAIADHQTVDVQADDIAEKLAASLRDFDAVVINQFGEVTDSFTDPTTWARELLRTWHGCAENERDTLLEHNADAIEEARRTPAALKVLLGLEEAPSASTEVVKIEPPMERGKINWPQYVRAIKAGIGFFKTTEELLAFCDQQRAHLIAAPMGQRVPAMRTILAALSAKGGKAPDWFSTLMSTNQAVKPIADVKPDPGQEVTKTADDRLVDGWIADMEKITLTEDFDALARTTPVKIVMARLRRENPALFERADQAFGKKFQELTASPPEAG